MEIEWIKIPSSEFIMGTTEEEIKYLTQIYKSASFLPEIPQRRVYIDAFEISKYPVTNMQFKEFVEATGYSSPASPYFHLYLSGEHADLADHPIAWVSWYDALAFCQWIRCRLPTEAEWEMAARGLNGFRYPWGDEWKENHCNSVEAKNRMTTPVGQYPQGASFYGVQDMAGNVWEWTDGWVTTDVLSSKSLGNDVVLVREIDDRLKHFKHLPVLRGGSLGSNQVEVRCAFRFIKYSPWDWGDWVGFRCVKLQRKP